MKNLNTLEKAIINEIASYNEKQYPFIKNHLPYLKVKSRESTGVGMYINFEYSSQDELMMPTFNNDNIVISSDKNLELDALEYGLNYELNITDGKVDFLELVTNGESWNGEFEKFKFTE